MFRGHLHISHLGKGEFRWNSPICQIDYNIVILFIPVIIWQMLYNIINTQREQVSLNLYCGYGQILEQLYLADISISCSLDLG